MSDVCIINSYIVQLFVEYTKVVIIIITLTYITSSTTHTHMIRPFDADLTISYSRDSSLSKKPSLDCPAQDLVLLSEGIECSGEGEPPVKTASMWQYQSSLSILFGHCA